MSDGSELHSATNSTLNSLDYWDYTIELECLQSNADLHLAAELGKTLLDRNRELETLLKEKQTTIEDQKLEIEYLTKQTVALKEVNDARLRIYEQLEVSIQDLERTNHRLQLENNTEKKNVKSLNANVEQLEARTQELTAAIEEIRESSAKEISKYERLTAALESQLENLCQQNQTLENQLSQQEGEARKTSVQDLDEVRSQIDALKRNSDVAATKSPKRGEEAFSSQKTDENSSSRNSRLPNATSVETQPECDQNSTDEVDGRNHEMDQIMEQLRRYERLNAELEEQLSTKNQQYEELEKQLNQQQGSNMMMSMHEELNTLDEVRQGQMCSKCLRNVDQSSDFPDDDDQSMLNDLLTATPQHRSSFTMNVQDHVGNQSSPLSTPRNANPYKVLVEKYEALVEVHRGNPLKTSSSKSFQEEMHMSGEFTTSTKDTDEESGHGGSHITTKQHKLTRKTFSTPTDFSEAETSSSGFSDETSNKSTQTDGRVGSFLCTIADGEDCKFSIYDDASPFDSRFRDRPEYRDLFKEIFRVLKKAAENKAEGEELPLLDDVSKTVPPQVPPVTPMNEQLPDFPDDDTQSVMSSTMSELSTQNETTTIVESIIESLNQPIPETVEPLKAECVLRPLVRQPLEYVSIESRKRSSSRKKNKYTERSDSPMTHIIGSPKITYSSRPNSGRRRNNKQSPSAAADENIWNGNTLQFWATTRANVASPTPSQGSGRGGYFEYKPSPASQDLNKLKNLEKTYAEVLRSDVKKQEMRRHRRTK
ncbi:girdin-like isoform X1 [Anthonomus grandis grandis]|uniref:girdin-like isoform X1 n=1 Tax=Anthonomus grandis grandis TaxID=2921223 RepID=UPI0021669AF1|nr:girdin-like isoform X1 [Anthonomus grandis grandis]